ncbi:MAG: hypothetical protein JWM64_1801 [Frankiales bacterium]|nr:hypothetical protein [Frankiales bacterium]
MPSSPAPSEGTGTFVRDLVGLSVLVALVLLRARRRRAARRSAGPAPTVPAVEGRTSGVEPVRVPGPSVPVPGRPRLAPVHAGSVPHDAVGAVLTELVLPPGRLVVGRADDADVRLDDPTVSPRHALLEVGHDGAVTVRDLGALNGLAVDGVPVVTATLNDGNRLDLGEVQLVFRCDPREDDGGRQGGELGEQPHQREQGTD